MCISGVCFHGTYRLTFQGKVDGGVRVCGAAFVIFLATAAVTCFGFPPCAEELPLDLEPSRLGKLAMDLFRWESLVL